MASSSSSSKMDVRSYFDTNTSTWTYLVIDLATKKCALIDTVLDFDMQSGTTSTTSADKLIAIMKADALDLEWILETHVHADHMTASAYIKKCYGGSPKVAIDGSQFDHLFKDEETFQIGSLKAKVFHTPGHTPACITYLIDDVAFVGDTIFMPEIGTARTDFPGGSAETMYESCRRILSQLPPHATLHVGHDYPSKDQAPLHAATVAEHLKSNAMVNERVSKEEFVEANKEELPVPRLLLPSLQVNLRAGRLGPHLGSKQIQYLMIPLNLFNKNKKEF